MKGRAVLSVLAAAMLLVAPAARAGHGPVVPPTVVFQATSLSALQPSDDDLWTISLLQGMATGAFSADGKFLYVASWYDNTITTFGREASTGKLRLLQILDYYDTSTDGLFGAEGVAISPDGQFVYVTSGDGGGLLGVFSRDATTGALTFVQEAANLAPSGDLRASAFPPDGYTLYTMEDGYSEVVAWTRDGLTGELTYLGSYPDADVGFVSGIGDGLQSIAVSPDGNHVYAGRAIYSRNPISGALTALTGRSGVEGLGVAISADGNFVYASGGSAVEVFSRNAGTGALTSIQVMQDGVGGVDGLGGADNLVLSPDGKHLYVNGKTDHAVAVFSRNAGTGMLTFVEQQRQGVNGVFGLHDTAALTISPDGAQLYVSGWIEPSSLTVFARDAATGALHETDVYRGTYSGCEPFPDSGCRFTTLPGKAKLLVQDSAVDSKDLVVWKWTHGEFTDFSDFEDPLTDQFGESSDHSLCVYDDTGLLVAATAPAGAMCRTKACWREVDNKTGDQLGYEYNDALRASYGMNKMSLRKGDDDFARVGAKVSGVDLHLPPPPYSGTVIVQLKNDAGTCWEADFSDPVMNQPGLYRGNSD
jgi:6-phosphogluconolactonase (cycloisomerase 2 family)